MLAPRWFRIRLGPYLRNEPDKREYYRLFNNYGYLSGFRRYQVLLASRKLSAETQLPLSQLDATAQTVVVFRNAYSGNLIRFHEIVGQHDLLHEELRRITCPQYLPAPRPRHIAVHVRMGDFASNVSQSELKNGENNSRLPIEWYVEMLSGLRRQVGMTLPALVYSDGPSIALLPLLQLPNVVQSPPAESITDMLNIAQATALLSSGSGFSIWGSFLGQVPRICYPGQRKVRSLSGLPNIDLEPECDDSSQIPISFIKRLRASFDG